jgi:hypothetical protein
MSLPLRAVTPKAGHQISNQIKQATKFEGGKGRENP